MPILFNAPKQNKQIIAMISWYPPSIVLVPPKGIKCSFSAKIKAAATTSPRPISSRIVVTDSLTTNLGPK